MITRRQFSISLPMALALPAWARAAALSNPVACQSNAWKIDAGDFDELLKRAADMKRLGYQAFECNVRYVDGQFANPKAARERIAETGMTFFGTHMGLQQPQEDLDKCVEGAAALGAKRFTLSGGGGTVTKDGKLDREALDKKVKAIMGLAARCKTAGYKLVYHNHTAEFEAGGKEIKALLKRTDPELVSLLWDVGHAYRAGCKVTEFFTRNHARIDAIHLRDIRNDEQVPLGEGELDYPALAAAVRETAWPGWLTIEEENLWKRVGEDKIEPVLKSDRQAIRKFFGV